MSPSTRRSYDPDKHAALTLGELEAWFAQQIVGRYHQEPHRGLKGGTPAGAWALHPAPALAPGPLKRFRIAFLPAISRTLRRDGIVRDHAGTTVPIAGMRSQQLFAYRPFSCQRPGRGNDRYPLHCIADDVLAGIE